MSSGFQKNVFDKPQKSISHLCLDSAYTVQSSDLESVGSVHATDWLTKILNDLTRIGLIRNSVPQADDASRSCIGNPKAAVSEAPTSCIPTKITPSHDYEEGMNVFNNYLPFLLAPAYNLQSHSSLATTLLFNLGLIRTRQQQFEQAEALFIDSKVMAANMERKLAYHIMVPILHNIGYVQYRQGKLECSIATFNQALQYCSFRGIQSERYLAATLNCLGVLYFHIARSKTNESLNCLRSALAIQAAADGSGLDLATTLNNIGRVLFMASCFEDAIAAYIDALKIRKILLGDSSLDVAATLYNLGQSFHKIGNYEKAMSNYEDFLAIAISRLGKNHRDVLNVLKCIGDVHHQQGNVEKAIISYFAALSGLRSSFGIHPEVACLLNKIGNVYYEVENLDKAMDMYYQGLAIERLVLQKNHPNIAVTLSNIGQVHKQRGDYDSALRLYKETLEVQLAGSGGSNLSVAATLSHIGIMCYQTRRYQEALHSYQHALVVRRELLGEENLDVASTMNSIGLVLFRLGMFEKALEAFSESLQIRAHITGSFHQDVAVILYNIGTSYLELGMSDEAIRVYRETLRVERKVLGSHHSDVALTLQYIGQLLQQRGDLHDALLCYREVLEIQKTSLPRGSEDSARTMNTIANLELCHGNTTSALYLMAESARMMTKVGADVFTVRLDDVHVFYAFNRVYPGCAPAA